MKSSYRLLAALAAALLLLAACSTPQADAPTDAPAAAESSAGEAEAPTEAYPQKDGASLGDPNAPVQIIEFFDFQCPHCYNSYLEIEKGLIAQYVNSGQVYLTYKPVGFLGADSVSAAQGANCAADQNFFWEFHDLVFANFSGGNSGAYSAENLATLAGQIGGLDLDQFSACMADDSNLARIQAIHDEAEALGVNGVPGFVINGQVTLGEQSMAQISGAIEDALNN